MTLPFNETDLAQLRQLLQLLSDFGVEEYSHQQFSVVLKKRPQPVKVEPTPQELLSKHLALPEEAPWERISNGELEAFSITGKVQ